MKRVMKFLEKDFDPDMLNHSTKLNNKNVTLAPNGQLIRLEIIVYISLEPSTSQVSRPIYKSAIYDWVHRVEADRSTKTRIALRKLEKMDSWLHIKRLFPFYKKNPSQEKAKIERIMSEQATKETYLDYIQTTSRLHLD